MAGVFTVLGLAVLLKLGFWQLDRLEWKEAILTRIETNMTGQFLPQIPEYPDPDVEYSLYCANGEFLHDKELYVFTTSIEGMGGVHIYTPLKMADGEVIIVNRGWVPNNLKDPKTRPEGQVTGQQTVCGYLRLDRKQGWFKPDNNPGEDRWFTPKIGEMAAAAGVENVGPFFLEANNDPNPGGYPVGGQTFVNIPNNHLGYAITWFGLAGSLLVVFSVFAYSQRRKK